MSAQQAEPDNSEEFSYTEANLPLWRELTWGAEWLGLRASLTYWGLGVPRGDGAPVVLVPGFLGSDAYLTELREWLRRIGYSTFASGIGRNADCPDVLLEKLIETVEAASQASRQKVRLVGHSIGGSLAYAAAVQRPDLIAQVVTLGSPLRGIAAHPLVVALARLATRLMPSPRDRPRRHGAHLHAGSCASAVVHAMKQPLRESVLATSVYSRNDGVVDWRSSVYEDPERNVEVSGSHTGLVVNREAYRAIANALVSAGQPVAAH